MTSQEAFSRSSVLDATILPAMPNNDRHQRKGRRPALLPIIGAVVSTVLAVTVNLATDLIPDSWTLADNALLVGGVLLVLAAISAIIAARQGAIRSDSSSQHTTNKTGIEHPRMPISQHTGPVSGGTVAGQINTVNYFTGDSTGQAIDPRQPAPTMVG